MIQINGSKFETLDTPIPEGFEVIKAIADEKIYLSARRTIQVLKNGKQISVEAPTDKKKLQAYFAQLGVRFYILERIFERVIAKLKKMELNAEDLESGIEELLDAKIKAVRENYELKAENKRLQSENEFLHKENQNLREYINERSRR